MTSTSSPHPYSAEVDNQSKITSRMSSRSFEQPREHNYQVVVNINFVVATNKTILEVFMSQNRSQAGLGDARDAPTPIPRLTFLHSHTVFGKNDQIVVWRPP